MHNLYHKLAHLLQVSPSEEFLSVVLHLLKVDFLDRDEALAEGGWIILYQQRRLCIDKLDRKVGRPIHPLLWVERKKCEKPMARFLVFYFDGGIFLHLMICFVALLIGI